MSLTSGVFVVGRSVARSVARCGTTLLFLSTLKLARNFVVASWIGCSLCSSNWSCSSVGKVSQVGSMILLGETSELSLEPTIEGRSNGSICAGPQRSRQKCALTPIRAPITALRTGGDALCTGVDSPRLGAGRSTT
jgi:hypothetical protein